MSGKVIATEIAAALDEASTAVGKSGFLVVFIRPGEKTGPEWAPVFGPPTEHPVRAIQGTYTAREIDGTLIQANDLKLTVEAGGFVPDVADKARINGKDWFIVRVDPVAPGGVALMYKVQVRK